MSALTSTLRSSRAARAAFALFSLMILVALLAPVLASDLPLAVRLEGKTYWLPCVTRPVELLGRDQQSLETVAEWQVKTPIAHGPAQSLFTLENAPPTPPPWAPQRNLPLGSDEISRDVLARIIHGARTSLFIAVLTVALALLIGVILGGLAGLLGGWVDAVISRLIEIVTALPGVLVLIAVLATVRVQSLTFLAFVIALLRWPDVARLMRSEVHRLKRADFILLSRTWGATPFHLVRTHLLPNAAAPLLLSAVSMLASTLLLESALSFLGLGVAAPTASWGELLAEAHRTLVVPGAWWLAVFPGLMLAATVLCAHVFGEAAQRTFDGRS